MITCPFWCLLVCSNKHDSIKTTQFDIIYVFTVKTKKKQEKYDLKKWKDSYIQYQTSFSLNCVGKFTRKDI